LNLRHHIDGVTLKKLLASFAVQRLWAAAGRTTLAAVCCTVRSKQNGRGVLGNKAASFFLFV
jgi:hypothetical protein